MVRKEWIWIAGMIILTLSTGVSYAGLTGVIAGKVINTNGDPMPGVTVTVSGPALQGERVDVTSQTGTFRMPELPPGVYELKGDLYGLQPYLQTDIRVSVNTTATVNFTMQMQKFTETAIVIAEAQVVDAKSATVKTTIERDVTERLPGSDDLFSAFAMTGGTVDLGTGNVNVKGGADNDNLCLFDGVDTTDPVTGTFGANLNADAIAEVEVQTGGFAAEYGRARGGIVNAVTRSGGNDFHGILRLRYRASDWEDSWKHPQAAISYDQMEPTVTLEGPIMRDKLWFMATYQLTTYDISVNTLSRYGGDPDLDYDADLNRDRFFHLPYIKLTYQATQSHKLVANYSGENAEIKGTNQTPEARTQVVPDCYETQTQGGPFYSLEWTWLYSPTLFFVSRVGLSNSFLDVKPQSLNTTDPRKAHFYDTYYDQYYNNGNVWVEDDRDRSQLSFVGNYFVEDLWGAHEFKSGFELHHSQRDSYVNRAGGANYTVTQIPMGDPANPDYYVGTEATREILTNVGTTTESSRYLGVFVQDTWSIFDNLTVNAGVRFETATYYNNDDESSVPGWKWGDFRADQIINPDGSYKRNGEMKFDDMLAPRLGINWDIFGNGKSSVSAFWGRFYNPFDLSLPGMFQPPDIDNSLTRNQRYTGPQWEDRDRDGVPDQDFFFDDANWMTTSEDEAGDISNLIDPNIEAEYNDEYTIGFEQVIRKGLSVNVNYTHRETNDMLEDVGLFVDDEGNIVWTYLGGVRDDFSGLDPNKKYDPRDPDENATGDYAKHIYYVTNAKGNTREYDGVELNIIARQDLWDLQASYTLSKAEGAVIEQQEDSAGGTSQFSGQFDTYGTTFNLYGELPWSPRHFLKVAGSVHYPVTEWYEVSLGVDAFLQSGFHYSKRTKPAAAFDPDNPSNDFADPSTWTGKPPYKDSFWSFPYGRGTETLPSFYNVDISFQNTFSFGKFGSATLQLDVDNITDYQGINSEIETYNPRRPELFGQADGWGAPRTYRIGLKYAF